MDEEAYIKLFLWANKMGFKNGSTYTCLNADSYGSDSFKRLYQIGMSPVWEFVMTHVRPANEVERIKKTIIWNRMKNEKSKLESYKSQLLLKKNIEESELKYNEAFQKLKMIESEREELESEIEEKEKKMYIMKLLECKAQSAETDFKALNETIQTIISSKENRSHKSTSKRSNTISTSGVKSKMRGRIMNIINNNKEKNVETNVMDIVMKDIEKLCAINDELFKVFYASLSNGDENNVNEIKVEKMKIINVIEEDLFSFSVPLMWQCINSSLLDQRNKLKQILGQRKEFSNFERNEAEMLFKDIDKFHQRIFILFWKSKKSESRYKELENDVKETQLSLKNILYKNKYLESDNDNLIQLLDQESEVETIEKTVELLKNKVLVLKQEIDDAKVSKLNLQRARKKTTELNDQMEYLITKINCFHEHLRRYSPKLEDLKLLVLNKIEKGRRNLGEYIAYDSKKFVDLMNEEVEAFNNIPLKFLHQEYLPNVSQKEKLLKLIGYENVFTEKIMVSLLKMKLNLNEVLSEIKSEQISKFDSKSYIEDEDKIVKSLIEKINSVSQVIQKSNEILDKTYEDLNLSKSVNLEDAIPESLQFKGKNFRQWILEDGAELLQKKKRIFQT